MNAEYKERGERGEGRGDCRVSGIHHSSFIAHHSPHSRRGFTILEVLVSMAVLIFGLLGVAALIPLAKHSMIETNKSDRTGACGRAGLHDVKIRRMLDFVDVWYPNQPYILGLVVANNGCLYECTKAGTTGTMPPTWPTVVGNTVNDSSVTWKCIVPQSTSTKPVAGVVAIDPRGVNSSLATTPLGGGTAPNDSLIPRITFRTANKTIPISDSVFQWRDDLNYASAKESKVPSNGDRPIPVPNGGPMQQVEGNYSWFVTVTPSPTGTTLAWNVRRQFDVSIVVCHKRQMNADTADPANAGETIVQNVVCDSANGIGGIGIEYTGSRVLPKANEWVLLCSENPTPPASRYLKSATWYRVVAAGNDGTTTRATLVGPDWHGGDGRDPVSKNPNNSVKLIVIKGVSGVYTTTMQLDNDGIWSK